MSDLTPRAFAEALATAALAPVLGVTPRSIPRLDWSPPADAVPAPLWPGRSTGRSTRPIHRFPVGPTSAELPISAGFPGLFMMNGLGEAGLPTSLQLTGRAITEGGLLEIGMQYQQRTTFHRLRPNGL